LGCESSRNIIPGIHINNTKAKLFNQPMNLLGTQEEAHAKDFLLKVDYI